MCFSCKRERARQSYVRHAERVKAKSATWRQNLRHEVRAHYGESCACCGESHPEFLCIDHIEGGGNAHRLALAEAGEVASTDGGKTGLGGIEFYSWLKRNGWPEGYRTLCHNCNQARGSFGFCPHEIEVVVDDTTTTIGAH